MAQAWLLLVLAFVAPVALRARACNEASQDKCPTGRQLQASRQDVLQHVLLQSEQVLRVGMPAPREQTIVAEEAEADHQAHTKPELHKAAPAAWREPAVEVDSSSNMQVPPFHSHPQAVASWPSLRGAAAEVISKMPTTALAPGILPPHGPRLLAVLQETATRLGSKLGAHSPQQLAAGGELSKVRDYFFQGKAQETAKEHQGPGGGPAHRSLGAGPGGLSSHHAGTGPGAGSPLVAPAALKQMSLAVEIASSMVYIVLVLSFAYIYAMFYQTEAALEGSPMKPPGLEAQTTGTFHFGLWDCDGCCGRDAKICLCSWCCLGIRWADTLSQPKLRLGTTFWSMVLFSTVCFGLDQLTLGLSTIVFIVAAVGCRQRLRATFGLDHSTLLTVLKDCLTWVCCFPCAAVQEAREVEYVSMAQGS